MDYLRRYHAADMETMTLVMKHFSVYREWALHLEQSAQARLQQLKAKTVPSEYTMCFVLGPVSTTQVDGPG